MHAGNFLRVLREKTNKIGPKICFLKFWVFTKCMCMYPFNIQHHILFCIKHFSNVYQIRDSMSNERLSFKIDFAIIISVNLQHMEICLVDVNLDR